MNKETSELKLNFKIEHKKVSATQGNVIVYVNDKKIATYGDKIELVNGEWQSVLNDKEIIKNILFPNDIRKNVYPKEVERIQADIISAIL